MVTSNKNQCKYCNKILSCKQSKSAHHKICKGPKIEQNNNQILKHENQLLKEQLNNILKSHKMHPKTFQKIIIN